MTLNEYKTSMLQRYNALSEGEKEMVRGIMRSQYAPIFVKVLGMDLLGGLPELMPAKSVAAAPVEQES